MKLLILLTAYLLGSIPWAYLLGKWLRGIDLRYYGSGNLGTMNARRILGWPAAILIFVLDTGKGALAVYLALLSGADSMLATCLVVGGHTFPVWLGFRGGKGLAAGLGALAVAGQFMPILIFVLGWIITYPLSRKSDLANIIAIAAVGVYALLTGPQWWLSVMAFIIIIPHLQAQRLEEQLK